ncbi:hypothetical protein [Streptomyces sp. NPDC060194]|uniref:hypothetical protein n=1 Tax=Streptomyces sp. NPDC060194 TaxID=3347069 RepID=UPI00364792F8
MPATPSPLTAVRSAEVVNGEIRALWTRAGGVLTPEQRKEYERLVTEWAEATRVSTRSIAPATAA